MCKGVLSLSSFAPAYQKLYLLVFLKWTTASHQCFLVSKKHYHILHSGVSPKLVPSFRLISSFVQAASMSETGNSTLPAIRIISSTTNHNGITINNNVYIFERSCDLSQLQHCDLSNLTLHFEGEVNIDTLQALNLNNVTLIFKNGIRTPCRVSIGTNMPCQL